MKKTSSKETIPKCSAPMSMPDVENKVKKSAWDVANEWRKLGKEKIRKMEFEEVCVSS